MCRLPEKQLDFFLPFTPAPSYMALSYTFGFFSVPVTCNATCRINNKLPTENEPLVLFTETFFRGRHLRVSIENITQFAYNMNGTRTLLYRSARVWDLSSVTWQGVSTTSQRSTVYDVTSDIEDLEAYLLANQNVGGFGTSKGIMFNYWENIDRNFYILISAGENNFLNFFFSLIC